MASAQFRARITLAAPTTTTIVPHPCAIREIVISPDAVGSAMTLRIQDQAGTPFVLVPTFTMAVPTNGVPTIIKFDDPIRMDVGVDAVTGGTAAGAVSVWITAESGTPVPS